MTSETPEQEKISPSKNPLKPPLEIAVSLIVMFIGTLGVILLGYLQWKDEHNHRDWKLEMNI